MSDWTTPGTLALGFAAVLYFGRRVLCSRTFRSLPPGPPGLPWVGNVTGIDACAPWVTYSEWARTYGDIVYSRLFGKDVIIINSEKIAKDLLENRSRNYSDRPYFITNEMCGVTFSTVLMGYGDQWRLHRRFFHQTFRLDATGRFLAYQNSRACRLLQQLFDTPEQLDNHVFEYTASVILNGVYGYDPASRKDELVDIAANVLDIVIPALRPDLAVMVGAFPVLLHLPSWLPGMSFKREMAKARACTRYYLDRPFEYSLKQELTGSLTPSMVHDGLRHMEGKEMTHKGSWMEALKEASGSAFLAASETSNSFLMTFFLMMMLNPAAQEKAQAQIDAAVGQARLPTTEDRPLLPYIDAILWETIRYSPIVPLSVPHGAMDDDVYEGFHIPKGAIIFANLWSMAHDESRYPNPHMFLPERFLNSDGSLKPIDMEHIAFGFGRRICVGKHFAETSVWTVIAKVLAVFKILKPVDENGVEIPVEPRFSSGLTIHPLPFPYKIVPRFPEMDAKKLKELTAASAS